ncbi:MAG: DUF1847 domain-containing protein [Methanosarcinaceae archaeon]|nr:DUF1847 domain-containing protein [Methanosarcinaceae archaeon]MDD4749556.1 DUF1847 domain-containing protein [Methanosarcinaceae archaeon]
MQCILCKKKDCLQGRNCSLIKSELEYSEKEKKELLISALFQAESEKKRKLEEIVIYAKKMGYTKIGIAFAIEYEKEARLVYNILSRYFEIYSVCCKVCGFGKEDFGIPKKEASEFEAACNPKGQARLLNEDGAELNLMLGLDTINEILFSENSAAPALHLPEEELRFLNTERTGSKEPNRPRKPQPFKKERKVREWV